MAATGSTTAADSDMGATSMTSTTDADTDPGSSVDSSVSGGDGMLDEDAIIEMANAYATDLVRVTNEPQASEHTVADSVHFYVQAEIQDLYLSVDPENPTEVSFEEGALLVKENFDADGNPDGYFAMYKAFEGYDPEGNDWYWLRANGSGGTPNMGKVGFCKNCHGSRAAVSDLVFGVPTDNRIE